MTRLSPKAGTRSAAGHRLTRVIAPTYAKEIVRLWLATPFEGGRHVARVEQIAMIERGEL